MTATHIALTTVESHEEAQRIARALVDRHLAACVNIIGPMESVFRWQDKVQDSTEYLLLIKTTADALANLEKAIHELHSYDLPEFIVLSIDAGSHEYLEWLRSCVG